MLLQQTIYGFSYFYAQFLELNPNLFLYEEAEQAPQWRTLAKEEKEGEDEVGSAWSRWNAGFASNGASLNSV